LSLVIRFRNAYRKPLPDRADVNVIEARTERTIARANDISTKRLLRVTNVQPHTVYKIRVFPTKHRPVGRFVQVPGSGERETEVFCPIHPDRVAGTQFPEFGDLDPELQMVLEHNQLENHSQSGADLYESLGDLPKAGLLNIWTKMLHTPLPEGPLSDTCFKFFGIG
jgi:hypothetical protein